MTICCGILARWVHLSGPHFSRTPCLACLTKVTGDPQSRNAGHIFWTLSSALLSHPGGPFLTQSSTQSSCLRTCCSLFLDTLPRGQLIISEAQLIGHLHWGRLLPRQNCGCAFHSSSLQHVSQTGRSLVGHGVCRLCSARSLTRAYLYPTSRHTAGTQQASGNV